MDYPEWIERERKIRSVFLKVAPTIKGKKTYRVCQNCGEICLCHEEACPNCNSVNICAAKIDNAGILPEERIRLKYRFEKLVYSNGQKT